MEEDFIMIVMAIMLIMEEELIMIVMVTILQQILMEKTTITTTMTLPLKKLVALNQVPLTQKMIKTQNLHYHQILISTKQFHRVL